MHTGLRRLACASLLATSFLAAAPLLAQGAGDNSTRYRLRRDSNYQEGCFDPCACPIRILEPLEGGFRLVPTGSDWLFRYFDVRDVDFRVGRDGNLLRARGSGTYKVGGEFAVTHQMTLDLQINDGPVEHFDSGLVAGGGIFPRIEIVVSLHGVFCYDKVFDIRARPAPDPTVDRDTLSWLPVDGALGFDVVMGDLGALLASGGDYTAATSECVVNEATGTSTPFDVDPAPGQAFWFVVRYVDPYGPGSYDTDMRSQQGERDPGINSAPGSCP